MKYMTIALALMLSGCSLISVQSGGSKPKKIPARPTVARDLQETLSQEAAVAHGKAAVIHASGTAAGSPDSKILLESTGKVVTFTGLPTEPVDTTDPDAIKAMHDRFENRLQKQRDREHEWESEILQLREERADLAAENGKLKVSFANLKLWFWIVVIGLVAVMVIFPSTIPLIVGWARKAGKALVKLTRRQMTEVVHAVQKIRKDESIPEEIREKIDAHLSAAQSSDTVQEIARMKKQHRIG